MENHTITFKRTENGVEKDYSFFYDGDRITHDQKVAIRKEYFEAMSKAAKDVKVTEGKAETQNTNTKDALDFMIVKDEVYAKAGAICFGIPENIPYGSLPARIIKEITKITVEQDPLDLSQPTKIASLASTTSQENSTSK